jgi:hypothetical protein
MPTKLPLVPAPNQLKLRKSLSMPGLLALVRKEFEQIKEHRIKTISYKLTDVLLAALAMFGLKYPSLLQFDQSRGDDYTRANLTNLYGVEQAPSDSQMREILDPVAPEDLRPAFRQIHRELQRQTALAKYQFLGGYLLSIDGTGQFSSTQIKCDECCSRTLRNGTVQYYHQLLAAVIVHPEQKTVLPLFPEAITRQDGESKNDCERNAAKRLLPAIRAAFPKLRLIVLEDSLAANAPHLRLLHELQMSYIIVVKDTDHAYLKAYVDTQMKSGRGRTIELREGDTSRQFHYVNQVPLNQSNPDWLVNYLEYHEIKEGQTIYHGSWITDIELTPDNVFQIMRAGRARWKIENETFNTLKNQNYHLEHNYGHGKRHLATVLATLMMLHFLIDQVQELACPLFQAARRRYSSRRQFWELLRAYWFTQVLSSWEELFKFILYRIKIDVEQLDTS